MCTPKLLLRIRTLGAVLAVLRRRRLPPTLASSCSCPCPLLPFWVSTPKGLGSCRRTEGFFAPMCRACVSCSSGLTPGCYYVLHVPTGLVIAPWWKNPLYSVVKEHCLVYLYTTTGDSPCQAFLCKKGIFFYLFLKFFLTIFWKGDRLLAGRRWSRYGSGKGKS